MLVIYLFIYFLVLIYKWDVNINQSVESIKLAVTELKTLKSNFTI